MTKAQVMKQSLGFKKKVIATVVAAGFSGISFAQGDGTVEEVTVTGIRASMERAMDVKRNRQGVVDAIASEDIGKMPDTNLAESLQRITGVSISRDGGEGSRITVRGLGSDFNLVTVNGRAVANATGGRSFEFANLASEMVSGVAVAKTSDVTVFSGGMGATVDLQTIRPLDSPGLKMIANAKGISDQSSSDAGITPEIGGLFSNTFADDTIGVAVGLNYQERENGSREAQVGTAWRTFDAKQDQDWSGSNAVWGGVPKTGHINRPTEGHYAVPQTIGYFFTEEKRERLNGNLVLQWAPTDELKATFDYMHTNRSVATKQNDVSAWFTFAPSRNVYNDAAVATPLIYSETYFTNSAAAVGATCNDNKFKTVRAGAGGTKFCPEDMSMGVHDFAVEWTSDLYGVNFQWQPSDSLSLEFDAAMSDAVNEPDSEFGSNNVISTAAFVRTSATGDFTTDIPTLVVGGGNAVMPSDMVLTGGYMQHHQYEQEIDQFRFSGNYEFNDMFDIDFGVESVEHSNHYQFSNVQRNDWGGVGKFANAISIFGAPQSIKSEFEGDFGNFGLASGLPHKGTLEDGTVLSSGQLDRFFRFSFADARQGAIDMGVPVANVTVQSNFDLAPDREDRQTVEETQAFFVQTNMKTEFGLAGQLGVRYETTDVTSTSRLSTYSGATWISDTEIELTSAGLDAITETGSYDNVLPSLNLSYEFAENFVTRFGASKSITRGGYGALSGGARIGQLANQNGINGSAGNPDLLPFESVNMDLSAEWYYADASYISVAYFTKDVTNFISNVNVEESWWGIRNPAQGGMAAEARSAVGSQGAAMRAYIFDKYPTAAGVNPTTKRIQGTASNDLMVFNISRPANGGQDQGLQGIEFNVQHVFGESGFGGVINYTVVDAENEYDDSFCKYAPNDTAMTGACTVADQEVLLGVSDTMNVVGFYEANGINVRLAYNWRDDYLSNTQREGPNPTYRDAYGQWDVTASYELTEQWQVYMEGVNVLGEATRDYGRDTNQTISYIERGARWTVGTRFAF